MYHAHRGIGPGPNQNTRLAELLEQVRAEFEAQGARTIEYEQQRESFLLAQSIYASACVPGLIQTA